MAKTITDPTQIKKRMSRALGLLQPCMSKAAFDALKDDKNTVSRLQDAVTHLQKWRDVGRGKRRRLALTTTNR